MKGLSRSNLQYIRSFADAWPEFNTHVPQPVGHVPWGHIPTILDKKLDHEARNLRSWASRAKSPNAVSRSGSWTVRSRPCASSDPALPWRAGRYISTSMARTFMPIMPIPGLLRLPPEYSV